MSDILGRLKAGLAEYPGIDVDVSKVTGTASLRADLGFDSLDEVALELMLEEEFRIVIPVGASDEWRTVSDVVAFIGSATASTGERDDD